MANRPKIARTPEEAALIPKEEPVEIVLSTESEIPQTPPEKPEPKVAAVSEQVEEAEDPLKSLREQLKRSEEAEKLAKEAASRHEQQARDMARERDESRTQSTKYEQQAEDARYTAVVNALGAATSEADAAQQSWESAELAGDTKAKAEAQRRLARAEANVARFEEAKESFDNRLASRPKEPVQPATRPVQDPIEQSIAGMPSEAQRWLRGHPEYLSDPRKNAKLQALHWDVVDEGHPQFTTGYFQSLEEHLGLRQRPESEEEPTVAPSPTRSRTVPSAPPSRDVPSSTTGRPSPSRVELTPEEREIARMSGVDELTYAKGKLELARRKQNGMYQEGRG